MTQDNLQGFRLLEKREVPETASTGYLYEHVQSGAKLLHLANDDDNKVFGIGFRTPSANSTGVAHILEHSVLNGSAKYRTKEPFMDMAKSSLSTFLNAMTFSDKTIYPVASRNDKDFYNLMDVYLDAVFHPSIYDTKEIFLQEGWHYHLEDEKDELNYRGVVYNEMRGALSGSEEQVMDFVLENLYPDTIYGYESGGDPYVIPELTYEGFLDFHRHNYHPDNSYIFLYGDMDVAASLAHIDSYLKDYTLSGKGIGIDQQAAFPEPRKVTGHYSVAPGEDSKDKDYFAYTVVAGLRKNMRDLYTLDLLSDVLIDSQAGPLRLALLEAGIGADMGGIGGDGLQIPFGVLAKECKAEDFDRFVTIVEDTLKKLVKEGLAKDQLRASLNKIEYSAREAGGYPTKGIIYYIEALESWLYDESPFDALNYEPHFAFLREAIDGDYFETFIQERILDNPHKILAQVQAKAGLNAQKDTEVHAKLQTYKASLSPDELKEMVAETHQLIARQNREDSPEEKATIPQLNRDDVNVNLGQVKESLYDEAGVPIHHYELFTAGISYIDMYLDADHIRPDELQDFSLLTSLIGAMDTDTHSYGELDTLEYLHTGGISIAPSLLQDFKNPDQHSLKLRVTSKVMGENHGKVFLDYVKEVISRTDLSNHKRLHEVVQMLRSRYEMAIFQQGHRVMSQRVNACYSAYHKKLEALSGLDFFFYLQDLDRNFEARVGGLVARLEKLQAQLLHKTGLVIGVTGGPEEFAALEGCLKDFINELPQGDYPKADGQILLEDKKEGIRSSAGVQYVAKGAHFVTPYSGDMEVLSNLVTNEYLYNNIRAKGGAYGQGLRLTRQGNLYCYSYRDPNLEDTIATFDGMGDYLDNLEISDEQLLPYIIGVMTRFDPAQTAQAKGSEQLRWHLIGKTMNDVAQAQAQALAASPEKIKAYAPLLRTAMEANHLCALGNSERLAQSADLFDKVFSLDQGK